MPKAAGTLQKGDYKRIVPPKLYVIVPAPHFLPAFATRILFFILACVIALCISRDLFLSRIG